MRVRCSAPGKVLIAGGYLILEKENQGLVISTSARFHSEISQETAASSDQLDAIRLRVVSPQFSSRTEVEISYVPSSEDQAEQLLCRPVEADQNIPIYVRLCLQLGLGLILQRTTSSAVETWKRIAARLQKSDIILQADNDFYSQQQLMETKGLPKSMESYAQLEPFEKVQEGMQEIRKTGLGSSATLVASLLASLFIYLEAVVPVKSKTEGVTLAPADRDYLHQVAQVIHCAAQGKVGSGFDVSTAVYGSQLYSRFSSTLIAPVLEQIEQLSQRPETFHEVVHAIHQLCQGEWDHQLQSFCLPPSLSMTLGDVNSNANTPSMVSKLLAWRAEQPEHANRLWSELASLNSKAALLFQSMHQHHNQDKDTYVRALQACARTPYSQWASCDHQAIADTLTQIHQTFVQIRTHLREMGQAAGVPIEPEEQTQLLDLTIELPGVVAAAVPGAGGFDALYAITIHTDDSVAEKTLEEAWVNWEGLSVLPQFVREDPAGGVSIEVMEI